ncbi:tyrosine-type recombinase/integrase [Coprobacillaceae bacterium CR2/5/TPMF4]|nr:tyrosine-type recombinase/integrase [Coprobacillaceae bacterium CR2/5/TPMF4]
MKTEKNQLKEELSIKQVHAILSQPNINKRKGRRDCCLMTILYDTGCRCDELLSLKLKDLRFNKDVCDIKILGKGRKYRATPLSKQATKILKTYLQEEKIIDNEQYLFSTNYNGFKHKMSADNVDRILSKYENELRTLGFEIPHLHPHLFRHTRAMHLYKNGVSLSLISQWLGHSNLETTLIYAYADTEMKRKAIDKAMNGKDMLYIEEEAKYSKEADNKGNVWSIKDSDILISSHQKDQLSSKIVGLMFLFIGIFRKSGYQLEFRYRNSKWVICS